MLDVRIWLLLLLEAGIFPCTSHAMTLPKTLFEATNDMLSTHIIREISANAPPVQQVLLKENFIQNFGIPTGTQFTLERNSPYNHLPGHDFSGASVLVDGASNNPEGNQLQSIENLSNSGAYAFPETDASTITSEKNLRAHITAPPSSPAEITPPDISNRSATNRRGAVDFFPSPHPPAATDRARQPTHHETQETETADFGGREQIEQSDDAAGDITEDEFMYAMEPGDASADEETEQSPEGAPSYTETAPSTITTTTTTSTLIANQEEKAGSTGNVAADHLTAPLQKTARDAAPPPSAAGKAKPSSSKRSDPSTEIKGSIHLPRLSLFENTGLLVKMQSPLKRRIVTELIPVSVSEMREISRHDTNKSRPVEDRISRKGPDLSKHSTQNLVNPEAIAQEVRKFVGLRAGSNLHLETQKLIEKNCDLSTFGPSYCASKENPHAEALLWSLEHRKNMTCFVIALIILAFGVIVQTLIRLLEDKISQGKDEFSKEVMETAFRQIATISIVNVLLWGVMQSNVATVLDQLIFGDVIPEARDSDAVLENVSPMLEVLFEELFFVSVILLVWYVFYVLIFQCLTRQLIDWMRRVDEEGDIPEVARQAEVQRKRCCGWLLGRTAIDKANFIAHRYEFGDNVQAISVPGVDPTGYYFMEYLRVALLRMAIEMIRLPNSTLIFLMFVGICLRPMLSFRLSQEAALLSSLAVISLFGMLLVWAYVYRIERQLRPRHIPQYLVLRYHMDVGGHSDSYVEQFTPPYKLQKQKDTWPGLMSFLYGTTLPNKHQQLFCFWANGPALVLRALEATFFCQLLVLAWWVQLVRNHPLTWFRYAWWGNLVVGASALVHFGLLKHVIYTVLVALNSGMLIDPELLEKVWDMQRAENMRLIAELTDALRVQSTLYAISEGGDIFWRQLLIRSKTAPRQAQEQRLSIWAGLDEEHLGQINREKVFRYLSSQGLPIKKEADVSEFLQVFDRDGKGGLNEEEFFVLVMIVKQMLVEPLDKDALRALFENEYGIPWTSAVGVDMPTLSKILAQLHLMWSEGKKRYLLDFVGGRRGTTSVSPDQFVTSLQAMDDQAMQPLQAEMAGRHLEGGDERSR